VGAPQTVAKLEKEGRQDKDKDDDWAHESEPPLLGISDHVLERHITDRH
jgi:hypothetical protein